MPRAFACAASNASISGRAVACDSRRNGTSPRPSSDRNALARTTGRQVSGALALAEPVTPRIARGELHIDAGQIGERIRPHRKAKVLQHAIDLRWLRASSSMNAASRERRAAGVDDEAVADAGHDRQLADASRERERRRDGFRRGAHRTTSTAT